VNQDETSSGVAAVTVDLSRVRARDPESLGLFFDRYFDSVHALAARMMGRRELAEDVAQEVFYRILRSIEQLDPARDPRPWIMAITANVCREVWRSRGYRSARVTDPIETHAAALTSSAVTDERRRERQTRVQESLLQLDPDSRLVILLHDYHGFDHAEIAETVGISHAAARKRYSRAIAILAPLLEGLWP